MKIFKYELKLLVLSVISITFLLSCEKDDNNIGADLIPDKSKGNIAYVDLIAYNISNNDTIRADHSNLKNGLLGVYEDNVFGKSKATFTTQIRLSDKDKIQGAIQEVDSVVLSIYPTYNASISKTREIVVTGGGLGGEDAVVNIISYPLNTFLGNKGASMNVTINRVAEDLETISSKFYSDKNIAVGDLLGTVSLSDSAKSISVKSKNGTTILEKTTPGYRIKLDASYFKQAVFNKKEDTELSSNEKFVKYFNGLRITPSEDTSKFIVGFPRSMITLVAYYRYKNNAADASYTRSTYSFLMNSASNTVVGQYDFFGRTTASSQFKQQMSNPDKTNGETQLYLQGMGGLSIGLKFDDAQMAAVRDSVQNKGWAIVGAKLNFNLAEDAVSKPSYIYGYNFTQKSFLPDLINSAGYIFNPAYNFVNNPGYYTLNITQYVKSIIEKNKSNDELLVGMGNFLVNTSGNYIGYNKTSRAYEPYRLIFYGNKAAEDQKLKLEIIYTKNK